MVVSLMSYKKKRSKKAAQKAADCTSSAQLAPKYATPEMLYAFRAELKSDVTSLRLEMRAGFKAVDERFAQIDARFAQIDARFDRLEERMLRLESLVEAQNAKIDRMLALFEEQRAENRFVIDKLQDLHRRVTKLENPEAEI